MVKQLGVEFHFGKQLGKDFTLEDLTQQGYEAVFLGIGLQDPNMAKNDKQMHESISQAQNAQNFWTSKRFLTEVCKEVKHGQGQAPSL